MKMTINKLVLSCAALVASLIISTSAFARGGGDNATEELRSLIDASTGAGSCSFTRRNVTGAVFLVPSGGGGNYNILGWGNGTGGSYASYRGMLERLATHCIFVAAATTSSSGDGTDVRDAVNRAKQEHANILAANPIVCTSGHSQGGGGAFNAANLLGADCVIPVQADTRFTTRIRSDLASDVEVVATWGSSDTLAPRSGNIGNVRDASSILVSIEVRGESHFAPNSGTGGGQGVFQRMAAKALLAPTAAERASFRRGLFGPATDYTVSEDAGEISDIERNAGAVAAPVNP